ncbi:type I-E CRISPR-associated protein Cse2/CasB [Nonomuraea sp. CA-143628]|uniref:type I-E CRISPR-associated protein Cse2/CasB n=1 Tax=Nonomuraea sp. CA-143628 TaxID=3239997 RepID=UPI003D8F2269
MSRSDREEELFVPYERDDERPPEKRLVGWLAGLVNTRDVGALADLRRTRVFTVPRLVAGTFAYGDKQGIAVFEQVAYLFARFHAGRRDAHYGFGSLGLAMRRIGGPNSKGPDNDGCVRLLNQILVSRQPPWRRIQHAIDQLRPDKITPPPSWAQLAVDLRLWNDPGKTVQHDWASDFYLPPKKRKQS